MPSEQYSNETHNGGFMHAVKSRNRAWTVTPNYLSVAKDNLPTNVYSDTQLDGRCPPVASVRVNNVSQEVFVTMKGFGSPAAFNDFESMDFLPDHRSSASMLNEAQIKALAKVSDAKTNLAVMFAEKAKTSNLILDSANRIYRAMRSFRRGDLKGVAENLNISPKRLHKSWLEAKYGWMPLLMDVKNSAEFLAQQTLSRPSRFTVSQSVKDVVEGSITGIGNNRMNFDAPGLESATYTSSRLKTVRVKLWLEISNPQLSQLQQLGLTNPALVAWELVPYSFVFDWFISVGSYLQGVTALHGITVRKAMSSELLTAVGSCTESFPGYQGVYDNYLPWSGLTRSASQRIYARNPLTVDPLSLHPPVDFSLPSWQKMVTSLALLRANSRSFGNVRT